MFWAQPAAGARLDCSEIRWQMITGSTLKDTKTPNLWCLRKERERSASSAAEKGERVFSAQENGSIVWAEGMDGMSSGDFSRWLTHAHLFSSCYQSLFCSKVSCTHDPSCNSAPNSRVAAVGRVLCTENPTSSSAETEGLVFFTFARTKLQPVVGFFLCHQHPSSLWSRIIRLFR